MIKKEDIRRAVRTFEEWDNRGLWDTPTETFKHHTLEKSENALKTAEYLLRIMEEPEAREFFDAEEYDGTLGIINAAYYRIFFLAQYLLALEGKKFPGNTDDTHKMVELALMYYFILKGSGLENKPDLKWEDVKQSRMSKALELMADAKEETQELTQQRAKSIVEYMGAERLKRHRFTYRMTVNAELAKAKTSIQRAVDFGDIIKGYIRVRKIG